MLAPSNIQYSSQVQWKPNPMLICRDIKLALSDVRSVGEKGVLEKQISMLWSKLEKRCYDFAQWFWCVRFTDTNKSDFDINAIYIRKISKNHNTFLPSRSCTQGHLFLSYVTILWTKARNYRKGKNNFPRLIWFLALHIQFKQG